MTGMLMVYHEFSETEIFFLVYCEFCETEKEKNDRNVDGLP